VLMTDTHSERNSQQSENGAPYPYASTLAERVAVMRSEGHAVDEWYSPGNDLDIELRSAKGPVLEIGGPSARGYYFLENRTLPSRPVIGNIDQLLMEVESSNLREDAGIDIILDGRDLPFADNSLGVVLSSHLPKFDDEYQVVGPLTEKDFDQQVGVFAISYAKKLLEDVGQSGHVDSEALRSSLRLAVANEVYKKLLPGGLYFTDCESFEVEAYEAAGFEVLAHLNENSIVDTDDASLHLSVVLKKPDTHQ